MTATEVLLGLLPEHRQIEVVDVGANDCDGRAPYASLLAAGLCYLTGFEPHPVALARLRAAAGPNETYLPHVVGDGDPCWLYQCAAEGMTSTMMPDPRLLARFPGFSRWGAVTEIHKGVETVELDEVLTRCDWLKIDIQGGEIYAFDGAHALLDEAVVVQTEVSFAPLYRDQPSFVDIERALVSHGLALHNLIQIKRWPLIYADIPAAPNQILEADAVYFRSPDRCSEEQLCHLALISHYGYGSFDVTARCLALLGDGRSVYVEAIRSDLANPLARLGMGTVL